MIFPLVHVSVSAFMAFLFALARGRLDSAACWVSLGVGFIVAAIVTKQKWYEKGENKPWNYLDIALFFFGGIVLYKHFSFIFYDSGDHFRTLNPLNLGDLPLHITFIRQMSKGSAFWPENPIFSGEKLAYPLGIDLYNALWDRLGAGLEQHLAIVGLVLGFTMLWALRRTLGWLGIAAYMFAFSVASPWKNFFLSMFITQRGFLFAVPAGLLLLELAWGHFILGRRFPRNHYIIMGFLWGVLPLFHVHTFIAVSLVFLAAAFASRTYQGIVRMLPWLALALPLIWIVSQGGSKAAVIHLDSGWMLEGRSLLVSWIEHLNIWWLLIYFSVWWLKKKKQEAALHFLLITTGLWFLFNFLILAPWQWDNLKILSWIFLAMLFPIAAEVKKLRFDHQLAIFSVVFLLTLLLPLSWGKTGGPVDVWRGASGTGASVELYKKAELWKSKEALSKLSGGPFMVHPTYNHPVTFWGRELVMGYPGHIWSHGLNEGGREAKVKKIFKGDEGWEEALSELSPRYIVWSEIEKREYGNLNPEIAKSWRKAVDVQGFEVYER